MRARATATAAFVGLALGVLGFAACSSGPAPSPASPPASTIGPEGAKTPAGMTTILTLVEAPPTPKPVPHSAADCKQVLSDLVNAIPDGGVVMNNAATSGDAGHSDRFQPMSELIRDKTPAYRCCFDLWARKHPEAMGREVPIKVVWNLKLDGTLEKIELEKEASQLDDPEVNGCMAEVSKGLTYPPSPSGKLTRFTFVFQFKVRR